MTPDELRAIRNQFGLSQSELAALLKVSDGRTVRRWEAGDRDIPGPAIVLLRLLAKKPALLKHL
ncbi:MAG: helix-turn-helix domain-containing protein [Rhodocyclaceae bacterium]|nr:helix-turn-helix domain-containing protein [Rhodocyclaceae bacterium]